MSGAAHSLQNLAPGLLFAPQRGHFAAIGEAHSLQNFAPWGFSAEQFGQRIGLSAIYGLAWRREIHLSSSAGKEYAPGSNDRHMSRLCIKE